MILDVFDFSLIKVSFAAHFLKCQLRKYPKILQYMGFIFRQIFNLYCSLYFIGI